MNDELDGDPPLYLGLLLVVAIDGGKVVSICEAMPIKTLVRDA